MTKLIAYSLYGSHPRYTVNTIINIELARQYYPDWKVLVYYDNTVPYKIINKIKSYSNCLSQDMTNMEHLTPILHLSHSAKMFWRFFAYNEPNVECVIFRDSDSYITQREVDAVKQWLSTDKNLHLMREVQPGHYSRVMGGMWGIRVNPKIISLVNLFVQEFYKNKMHYPTDQNYLSYCVYPLFENDMVVHDNDNAFQDKTHDWPTPRTTETMYIGRTQYPPCPESGMVERYESLLTELS